MPEDPFFWLEAKLKDVLTLIKNGSTQTQNKEGKGLAVTRIETISNGVIDINRVGYIEDFSLELDEYKLQIGDILLSHINSIEHLGKCAIYQGTPSTLIHGMNLLLLRCNAFLIDPTYLLQFLRSPKALYEIRKRAGRAVNQASINQQSLLSINIPLPPLPEQRRIAAILRQADELQQLRWEADEKSERLLPALFHKVFENTKSSKKRLGDFCTTKYGTSEKSNEHLSNGIPILRIPNIVSGELDYGDLKYINLSKNEREILSLKYGDVLLIRSNGNRNYVGKCVAYEDDGVERSFASYLIRVRLDTKILLPEYLADYLFTQEGRQQINEKTRTSAGQNNINSQSISDFIIPVPTLDKQKYYVELRKNLFELKQIPKVSGIKFNNLFQSLMSQAFTSELTAIWRKNHADELAKAAQERDELLAKQKKPQLASIDTPINVSVTKIDSQELIKQKCKEVLELIAAESKDGRARDTAQMLWDTREGLMLDFIKLIQASPDEIKHNLKAIIKSVIENSSEELIIRLFVYTFSIIDKEFQRHNVGLMEALDGELGTLRRRILQIIPQVASYIGYEKSRSYFLDELKLSKEQHEVYQTTLLEEGYFTAEKLSSDHQLEITTVRRSLQLLEGMGMIMQVYIPTYPTSKTAVYAPVYRVLWPLDKPRIVGEYD